MFSDPQTVTYSAVAKVLPAVSRGDTSSVYQLNDAGVKYELTLSHSYAKRNRVVARLRRDAYAADPLVPAQNILAGATATFTIDFPNVGLLPADNVALVKALRDWLIDATITKLVNGET